MNGRFSSVEKKERFWELDFLRGISVLLMSFDHVMQLMFLSERSNLQAARIDYLDSFIQNMGHVSIRILFFLLCGISCVLSRSNGKRGVQLLGVACMITCATIILDTTDYFDSTEIYFGVLHMLAIAILLCSFYMVVCKNIPYIGKYIPAAVGVFYILFFYFYINGKSALPEWGVFGNIIGFKTFFGSGSDIAPMFPEMGYVLIGSGLGQFYKSKYRNILKPLDGSWNRPVCVIGRYALPLYVAVPIVVGIFYTFILK